LRKKNLAHQKLKTRTVVVEATLRQMDTFNDRFGLESIPDELMAVLEGLTALPGKEYGEIVLAADAIIRNSRSHHSATVNRNSEPIYWNKEPTLISFRRTQLCLQVSIPFVFRQGQDCSSGCDGSLHPPSTALSAIVDLAVNQRDGRFECNFSFKFSYVRHADAPLRQGLLSVVPSMSAFQVRATGYVGKFVQVDRGSAGQDRRQPVEQHPYCHCRG
jgi:hypothetical protein